MSNKKLYIIPLLFLLTLTFVNAYLSSDIISYYSMENSNKNTSIIIDSQNGYNLSNNNKEYCVLNTVGKINNATYYGICGSPYAVGHNATLGTSLSSLSGYSINFWLNFSNSNKERFISISNGTNVNLNTRYLTDSFYIYNSSQDGSSTYLIKYTNALSGWNMITILHDQYNNQLQLYVNGNLVASNNTASDLSSFSTRFQLGFPLVPATMFDEVSVFKTLISSTDILLLYNLGNGIDYSETINSSQPIVPKCRTTNFCNLYGGACGNYSIDGSRALCSNPTILLSGQVLCNNADITNCAQGCFESNGVATCLNTCENECNVIGATLCSDSTTVSKCDDWNSDGCYEYRPSSVCATGQFCLNSGDYLGSCVNTTQNGTHGVYGLSVIPYSTSDGNTSYSDNTATRTITVNTIFSAHTQDFYTTGTNYISRTCDYTEPVIYSTGYVNVTSGNENIQTLTSASSQDTIIKLSLRPSDYAEGWITITDTLNSVNSKYYYQRNYSEKRMCLYDTSLNIIYCDYSTNSYDDLESLDFEYSFKFASKTYTTKVTFNRVVDNVQIIGAQTFLGGNIYKSNITQYIIGESTIINQLVITNPTPYNTFSSNTGGTTIIQIENPNCNCGYQTCQDYKIQNGIQAYNNLCLINQTIPVFVQSCIYTTIGNHLVRTYGNNNGVPDYSTYADYNVYIAGLGLTSDEVANANPNNQVTGGGLPQYMKYIIVAITIMILFGVFLGIGMTTDTIKVSVMVGTVLSMFAIVVYTVLGWISAWFIIAIIILGLAILILLGTMKATATG